jgi:pyruvate formate lyase activating enzyme
MPDQHDVARLWRAYGKPVEEGGKKTALRCLLCSRYCRIEDGESGKCAVRFNRQGRLLTRTAGKVAAVNLDPVEKKPLFHFFPGSMTFSLGSLGCNLSCRFCQNSEISQYSDLWPSLEKPATPAALVETALRARAGSISYTYNEPTVFFELLEPCAILARKNGLRNVLVSNAYMSRETFSALDGLIDAANFDLKSFSDDFYRQWCGGRLKPVLQTLKRAVKAGWWVEVTTLVITGLNDSASELEQLASFIAGELGRTVPWHVSRFRPAYLMRDRPPTPPASLELALEAGHKHGLSYVYAGNMAGHGAESTYCPHCGKKLIPRCGFSVQGKFKGRCPDCGTGVPGIWE